MYRTLFFNVYTIIDRQTWVAPFIVFKLLQTLRSTGKKFAFKGEGGGVHLKNFK